jgi:hypothetical protein
MNRSAKLKDLTASAVAPSVDDINLMAQSAGRDDRGANRDSRFSFPTMDELEVRATVIKDTVPLWKQRQLAFCKHYNIDTSEVSEVKGGKYWKQYKAWCSAQDQA